MSIVDNLYTLIGIAATKFNQEQLDYLIEQIKTTWSDSSFKLHDKLVGLLRMIGRDSKNNKIYSRVKLINFRIFKISFNYLKFISYIDFGSIVGA